MTEAAKGALEPSQELYEKMMRAKGWNGRKRNIYVCTKCLGHVITEDAEEGVTPFGMACRATIGCEGTMESSFYRVWNQTMAADFEWRKPNALEFAGLDKATIEHVNKGGLLIYPLTDATRVREKALQARLQARAKLMSGGVDGTA